MIVNVGFTAPIEGKKACIGAIEIVDLVGLAVDVEDGLHRVGSKPHRAGLMRGSADRNVLAEVEVAQFLPQPRVPLHVRSGRSSMTRSPS